MGAACLSPKSHDTAAAKTSPHVRAMTLLSRPRSDIECPNRPMRLKRPAVIKRMGVVASPHRGVVRAADRPYVPEYREKA